MATFKNTTINDTGYLRLPQGTSPQRPSGQNGMMRYNTSNNRIEYAQGTTWIDVNREITPRIYTGPGTWTKPAGLKGIKVTCIGGGAGGGGVRGNPPGSHRQAGGGGGGGMSIRWIPAPSIPGNTVPYAVGGGGAAGSGPPSNSRVTNGTSGGTTSFGTFLTATGGTNNSGWSGGNGGSGTASGGIVFQGQGGGGGGTYPSDQGSGHGGSSGMGGGARGHVANFTGEAGRNYGGGGSGGARAQTSQGTGGAGAGGCIIVEEFY